MTHVSGAKFSLGWVVFNDGGGSGLVRLTDLLAKAWLMEYRAARGSTTSEYDGTRAGLTGLANDIEALRAIGLIGQTPVDPSEPVLKLDDWLLAKQKEVEMIEAMAAQSQR
jgi:hypothetical protein